MSYSLLNLCSTIVTGLFLFILFQCSTRDRITPCPSDLSIDTVKIMDQSCISGSIEVIASGGVAPLTYSVDGDRYQENHQFNVFKGSYTVSVHDNEGCIIETDVRVGSVEHLMLSVTEFQQSGCGTENGAITLSASGGSGEYEYLMDEASFQLSPEFTGLAQGSYTFIVKDTLGCTALIGHFIPSGVSLGDDVMPVINQSCAVSGCHLDTSVPILDTKASVIQYAESIGDQMVSGNMPPSGVSVPVVSSEEVALITCWINDGTPNN